MPESLPTNWKTLLDDIVSAPVRPMRDVPLEAPRREEGEAQARAPGPALSTPARAPEPGIGQRLAQGVVSAALAGQTMIAPTVDAKPAPVRLPSMPAAVVSPQAQATGEQEPGGSLQALADRAAQRHGVDPRLVRALIQWESQWNPRAQSNVGAMGLMQLMPDTARDLKVQDPWDPAQNIEGGVSLLKWLLQKYNGDVRLALAAYNAGENAVDRYGGIPPFDETQRHVRGVMGLMGNAP